MSLAGGVAARLAGLRGEQDRALESWLVATVRVNGTVVLRRQAVRLATLQVRAAMRPLLSRRFVTIENLISAGEFSLLAGFGMRDVATVRRLSPLVAARRAQRDAVRHVHDRRVVQAKHARAVATRALLDVWPTVGGILGLSRRQLARMRHVPGA